MSPARERAMNKSDLTKAFSKSSDLPLRNAEEIVDMVFGTMSRALINGDRIEIRGFGYFRIKDYEGYTGRNPRTGEKIPVQPKKLPFFKLGKDFADRLNHL